LLILVIGADIMIGAASRLARKLKVPAFIVGLFIVAMGTSAPEAAIGIISGIQGTNLLTLGDVVGSSIINITVILGLTALIIPIKVDSQVPKREIFLSIIIQMALIIMVFTSHTLSRLDSMILLGGMFLFTGYIVLKTKHAYQKAKTDIISEGNVFDHIEDQTVLADAFVKVSEKEEKKSGSIPTQVILFFTGLSGLVIGANFAVNSAGKIAYSLGWSQEFIGLTVIAFGTSFPELVTCLVAAIKKEEAIALGNIIGSNIFNILFVLGISGFLHPITVDGNDVFFDLLVMIGASLLLIVPAYFYGKLSKITGFVFISCYIIYLAIKLSGLQ
jgi:cation:H+ antiporter